MTGETAEMFMARRGSAGKPLLLWAARRSGGLTLREAGAAAGGLDYTAVARAVKRLETRAAAVANLRQWMTAVRTKCEKRRRNP